MDLFITKSPVKGKRYRAHFIHNNRRFVYIDFGSKNGKTYIEHKDDNIRGDWIARHSRLDGIDWEDPFSASTLSRYILWEYPDITTAIRQYKKRFF